MPYVIFTNITVIRATNSNMDLELVVSFERNGILRVRSQSWGCIAFNGIQLKMLQRRIPNWAIHRGRFTPEM